MVSKTLIFSDGKKGHVNQSIAFCSYLDMSYDIIEVRFKNRFLKSLSYIFDFFGIYTNFLFENLNVKSNSYDLVVCAGSSTYYAAKTIAKKLNIRSVSMMLPKGYKYDFDLIFAQTHDDPPHRSNIVELLANFSYIKPLGLLKLKKESIGIVIGGGNGYLKMDKEKLKEQLDFIKERFKDFEIAITTSPRTPKEIEELIESYGFDHEVIYSKNPINPIPDFLAYCHTVFITSDSTSMISEAISYGNANVVVLPLISKKPNKFDKFIAKLSDGEYLHIFNGTIVNKNKKIDFNKYLKKINL
jgi:mitochondrial fission protein ELM1